MMKYASDEGLRQLNDDSSKAQELGLTRVACDPEKWSVIRVQPGATSDTIRNQGRDSNLFRAINTELIDDGEDHNSFDDVTLKRPGNHEGPSQVFVNPV